MMPATNLKRDCDASQRIIKAHRKRRAYPHIPAATLLSAHRLDKVMIQVPQEVIDEITVSSLEAEFHHMFHEPFFTKLEPAPDWFLAWGLRPDLGFHVVGQMRTKTMGERMTVLRFLTDKLVTLRTYHDEVLKQMAVSKGNASIVRNTLRQQLTEIHRELDVAFEMLIKRRNTVKKYREKPEIGRPGSSHLTLAASGTVMALQRALTGIEQLCAIRVVIAGSLSQVEKLLDGTSKASNAVWDWVDLRDRGAQRNEVEDAKDKQK